jgi:glycosyltransferase involved in cell wall biosynthesis
VDDVVKNMKSKSLLTDLISYGAKVTLAIEKAEGDVICFLDDDDRYSPWRLEVIRDKFKHNPLLIYYHNNVLVVDELGKSILDSSIEKTSINEEVFASTSEEKLASFIRYSLNLGLRSSSIAVKREFVSKGRPRTLAIDLRWSVDRIADEVYRLLEKAPKEKPVDIPTWSDVMRVYEERLYKG